MRKQLIVVLAVLSVAVLPAPRATAGDAEKVIGGLAALAIVGALVARHGRADDDGRRGHVVVGTHAPRRHGAWGHLGHGYGGWADHRRGHVARGYGGLPQSCQVRGRHRGALYGARCLGAHGVRLDRVSRRCLVPLRGHHRRMAVDARCIRHGGVRW